MGASAAFWLTRLAPGLRVRVVEADPSFARASTALSVASIRQQFSTEINVRISLFGIDFIRNISEFTGQATDLGLRENGYLFLAGSPQAARRLGELAAMQRRLGAATEVLNRSALQLRFPHLRLGDVHGGSFGPRHEGWFDNMGLLGALRDAARRGGAEFTTGRVAALTVHRGRVTGVRLDDEREIAAGAVVNAAGTRAAQLLKSMGEELPVEPRKRTVFIIDAPNAQHQHKDAPLLVDHTGFYLRPEGRYWLCAAVPADDGAADTDDFEPDLHQFEALIWERLHARCPGFDAVRVLRAWAGHYAYNTFDRNAIVGRWPRLEGLYLMNGFSGHGLQQAPAIGRGIAELIVHGGYRTLDLSDLGPERIFAGRPLAEQAIV